MPAISYKAVLIGRRAVEEAMKLIHEIRRLQKDLHECFEGWERLLRGLEDDRDPWLNPDPRRSRLNEKKLAKMVERGTHDTNIISGKHRLRESMLELRSKISAKASALRQMQKALPDDPCPENGKPLAEVVSDCLRQIIFDEGRLLELGVAQRVRVHEPIKSDISRDAEQQRHDEWAMSTLGVLSSQLEELEVEFEQALAGQEADEETLKCKIERHQWHINHLEMLRRGLRQNSLDLSEALFALEASVDRYVERAFIAAADEFFRDFYYDEIYEGLFPSNVQHSSAETMEPSTSSSRERHRSREPLSEGGRPSILSNESALCKDSALQTNPAELQPSRRQMAVQDAVQESQLQYRLQDRSRCRSKSKRALRARSLEPQMATFKTTTDGESERETAGTAIDGVATRGRLRVKPDLVHQLTRAGSCAQLHVPCACNHTERANKDAAGSGALAENSLAPDVTMLNSKGYPLRPRLNICTAYLQKGQCAFRKMCRFHHPEDLGHEARAWARYLDQERRDLIGAPKPLQRIVFDDWSKRMEFTCTLSHVQFWLRRAGPGLERYGYCPREAGELLVIGDRQRAADGYRKVGATCSVRYFDSASQAISHLRHYPGLQVIAICMEKSLHDILQYLSSRVQVPPYLFIVAVSPAAMDVSSARLPFEVQCEGAWDDAMRKASNFVQQNSAKIPQAPSRPVQKCYPPNNAEAHLSRDELIYDIFSACDVDGDAKLSECELRSLVHALGRHIGNQMEWEATYERLQFQAGEDPHCGLDIAQVAQLTNNVSSDLHCPDRRLLVLHSTLLSQSFSDYQEQEGSAAGWRTIPYRTSWQSQKNTCSKGSHGDRQEFQPGELLTTQSQLPVIASNASSSLPPAPQNTKQDSPTGLASEEPQSSESTEGDTSTEQNASLAAPALQPRVRSQSTCKKTASFLDSAGSEKGGARKSAQKPLAARLESEATDHSKEQPRVAEQLRATQERCPALAPLRSDSTSLSPAALAQPSGVPDSEIQAECRTDADKNSHMLQAEAQDISLMGDESVTMRCLKRGSDTGPACDGCRCTLLIKQVVDARNPELGSMIHPEKVDFICGNGEVCDALECACTCMCKDDQAIVTCTGAQLKGSTWTNSILDDTQVVEVLIEMLECETLELEKYEVESFLKFLIARKDVGDALFKQDRFGLAYQRYAIVASFTDVAASPSRQVPRFWPRVRELNMSCHKDMTACLLKLKNFHSAEHLCDISLQHDPRTLKTPCQAQADFETQNSEKSVRESKNMVAVGVSDCDSQHFLGRVLAAPEQAVAKHEPKAPDSNINVPHVESDSFAAEAASGREGEKLPTVGVPIRDVEQSRKHHDHVKYLNSAEASPPQASAVSEEGLMGLLREILLWMQQGLLSTGEFEEIKKGVILQKLLLPSDLRDLMAWRESGLLDDDEFKAAKQELLCKAAMWPLRAGHGKDITDCQQGNAHQLGTAPVPNLQKEERSKCQALMAGAKAALASGCQTDLEGLLAELESFRGQVGNLKKAKSKMLRQLRARVQELQTTSPQCPEPSPVQEESRNTDSALSAIVEEWDHIRDLVEKLQSVSVKREQAVVLQVSSCKAFLEFQQALDALRDVVQSGCREGLEKLIQERNTARDEALRSMDLWRLSLKDIAEALQSLILDTNECKYLLTLAMPGLLEAPEGESSAPWVAEVMETAFLAVTAVEAKLLMPFCQKALASDSEAPQVSQSSSRRDTWALLGFCLEHGKANASWLEAALHHAMAACDFADDLNVEASRQLEETGHRLQALQPEEPQEHILQAMSEAQQRLKWARRTLKDRRRQWEDAKEQLEDNDIGSQEAVESAEEAVRAARRQVQNEEGSVAVANSRLWQLQEAHFPELLFTLEERIAGQVTKEALRALKTPDRTKVTAMLLTDRRVEYYSDLEELGGRHEVFRGIYNGSACVLKKLPLSTQPGIKSFIRELRNLIRFSVSKNLYTVPLRGFFVEGKHGYLHFDEYPSDLEAWAAEHTGLPVADLLQAAHGLVSAVQYIHSANFVHGDLKPKNFLMDRDSRPLLCDFEFGRELRGSITSTAGLTSLTVGWSDGFVAPELCQGTVRDPHRLATKESDIFALGRTLQVLVESTGHAGSVQKLDALAGSMLSHDPSKRGSAAEAAEDAAFADIGGSASVVRSSGESWPNISPPSYWSFQQLDRPFHVVASSKYMKDQIEKSFYASDHCSVVGRARILSVKRIETQWLWMSYATKREKMKAQVRHLKEKPPVLSPKHPPPLAVLDETINEVFLWHGCPAEAVTSIAQDGFDERLAYRSCLYGTGNYFTPQACKALQYARAQGCSYQNKRCHSSICTCPGSKYLFYTRVCLGVPFYAQGPMRGTRRPPRREAAGGWVLYDSVVANPGIQNGPGRVQEHRECVVWNHAGMQAYAEFVVEIEYPLSC